MKSLQEFIYESKVPEEIKSKFSEICETIRELIDYGELSFKLGGQSDNKYDLFIIQKEKTYGSWNTSSYEILFDVNDKNIDKFDAVLNNDMFNIKFAESRGKHLSIKVVFKNLNGYDNLKRACELQDRLLDLSNVYDYKNDSNKKLYNAFVGKHSTKNYKLQLKICDVPEKFIQDFYQKENFCKSIESIDMENCNIDTTNVDFFGDIKKVYSNKRTAKYLYIARSDVKSIKGFNDDEDVQKIEVKEKIIDDYIEGWYAYKNNKSIGIALDKNPNFEELHFVELDNPKNKFDLIIVANKSAKEFCKKLDCDTK